MGLVEGTGKRTSTSLTTIVHVGSNERDDVVVGRGHGKNSREYECDIGEMRMIKFLRERNIKG